MQKRQLDYNDSQVRKNEYEQFVTQSKNEKAEFQKYLASDYEKHKQAQEEARKNKYNQEKQVEKRIVYDALDDLQKERMMKEKQRNEFKQSVDQLLQEKDEQKRQKNY